MVSDLLLHLYVEVGVAKGFITSELRSELIAEVLAHLLRDQGDIDQLLRLCYLLLKFQLETHVHFALPRDLGAQRTDFFLLVELLAVKKDELLFVGVSLQGSLFQCLVHRIELVPHFLKFV